MIQKADSRTEQAPSIIMFSDGVGTVAADPSAGSTMIHEADGHYVQAFSAIMCVFFFVVHVFVFYRDRPSVGTAGLYLGYVALNTATSFAVAVMGRESGAAMNTMGNAHAVVALALLAKLVISCVLFMCEAVPSNESRLSARVEAMKAARWTLLSTALPALLCTAADVLSVACQSNLPMTEIQVISKCGVLLTALSWTVAFRTPVGLWKWVGLVAITIGACFFFWEHAEVRATFGGVFSHLGFAPPSRHCMYMLLMLLQVTLSTFGGVSCEYLLRFKEGSVHLQNIGMYSWGALFLFAERGSMTFLTDVELTASVVASISFFTATGICTAFFLKHLGSVWKHVGYAAMVVVCFFLDDLFHFSHHSVYQSIGIGITLLGAACFVLDGWAPVSEGASADANAPRSKQVES